jgi:hypothetical protein
VTVLSQAISTTQHDIVTKLNVRKNRLLLVLQASIAQPHQYEAVRKILLDELGNNGFQRELEEALQHTDRNGTGGNTNAMKGGAL